MSEAKGFQNPLTREDTNTDHLADIKDPAVVEEVAIQRLTEEQVFELSKESLRFKSWTTVRIALIMVVQGCNQAGYGIDWAVISGINAYPLWHSYFGFASSGVTYATINALMTIGTVCGAPFLSFADIIGRRGINFAGNFIVLLAALLQGFAINLPMFMAGRFFLGFGSALMSSSQYMGEVAPTHLRGRLVGIFGACFQVGSLVMDAALIGFAKMDNNWGWRIPLLCEAIFPAIVCLTIYVLTPESPRYLIMKGQEEKARKVIARYQTTEGDDPNHPLCDVMVTQIRESLQTENSQNRDIYDFRPFLRKGARWRLLILILYSLFQQWNGGGIIGQYLVPALETVGITSSLQQLGINLASTAVYFIFTLVGSLIIDRFYRRTLIFAGLSAFITFQTIVTVTSWQYSTHGTKVDAVLTVVWIFLFQVCSATLIATMHNLYPVEVLSLALRAKGMALYSLVQGAAGTASNYGISVGISEIGYKIWTVYIAYNCVQLVVSYFCFPETCGLSLEEIDVVFETEGVHPVKMSLEIQRAKREKERERLDEVGANL